MITGAEISREQARLLYQYVQALERQIAAETKEIFQFQKLISQLTQDNNRLTDSYYALKKEKQNYQGQVKWLQRELQLLQRDVSFLLAEKERLQLLLIQAQSQLPRADMSNQQGNAQAPSPSECSGSCKTAFQMELGQLKRVAGEREEKLRQLQQQRDKALEEGESLKRQRSVLLQSYNCDSILQLCQRLSSLERGQRERQQLKDNNSMKEAELAQMAEKLDIALQQISQMNQVSIDLEKRNHSLQMELELNSQGLKSLTAQLTLTSQVLTKKEREIAELQLQNGRVISKIEMGNSLGKELLKSELLSLSSSYDELRSKFEKVEEQGRISILECQALERSMRQMMDQSQVLVAQKEGETKKLIEINHLLQLKLCQKNKQIEEYQRNFKEAQAQNGRSLRYKQNGNKLAIRSLQEQLEEKSSEVEHLNRNNETLRNSLYELQSQAFSDKLEMEMMKKRVLQSESHNQSPQLQALSEGVVILKEAMDEQRRMIESLSEVVRQREEQVAVLESSNSELRRQIVSAINNQEQAMKELTRERERSELRTRKRQKPYYFSRVTCYQNELDSFCRQSEKPNSTSRNMIDPVAFCPPCLSVSMLSHWKKENEELRLAGNSISGSLNQPYKLSWPGGEESDNFNRSLVQEIIHLNSQCDEEEAAREVVKVF